MKANLGYVLQDCAYHDIADQRHEEAKFGYRPFTSIEAKSVANAANLKDQNGVMGRKLP
jgi:hypothetical protein